MINKLLIRQTEGTWLGFSDPVEVIVARHQDEVLPMFERIQAQVDAGYYAAGFVSYEAAPGFDCALVTRDPDQFPLLCFGLYQSPETIEHIATATAESVVHPDHWLLSLDSGRYSQHIDEIKRRIESGDTYQVNYTIRQRAEFAGDPWALFCSFAVDAPYAAFIDLDDHAVCCASPELFFEIKAELRSGRISTRPMKGTARRGLTLAEDLAQKKRLGESPKDRAENIMIVDMIRNDIGKIATTGSVRVNRAFLVEKYPTLWQMTSSVSAVSKVSVVSVMQALFPCASITGAPKVNTMAIIRSLEPSPRHIYTGSIGFMSPNGDAQFNVAIRTALIDKKKDGLEYGIGGGIVWDSDAEQEYDECLLKAKTIRQPQFRPSFSLIETLLWTPKDSYFLLDYHLRRLRDSAEYFDIHLDLDDIEGTLSNVSRDFEATPYKVRLLLRCDGENTVTSERFDTAMSMPPGKVAMARHAVNSGDVFLYHKTTRRGVFEQARENFLDRDDVLLWNEKREMTESTIANLVIKRNDKLITPRLSCGLLAGTFRQFLLDSRQIEEGIITREEIKTCPDIYLINSVRQWRKVVLD
ncbi:MAG: aminodeoxychorismate synthase component I [bacterium]|nr:aminodeoxychorismate synthase component I [Gammaproteobacteria bacterium]